MKRLHALAFTTLLAASSASLPQEARITMSSCQVPGLAEPARCGVLEVPENPALPAGRPIPIHVAVVPATGGQALPDPIVVLMGGPGEAAISASGDYAAQFTRLRNDRDLVLIDQRGTGESAALPCKLYSERDPGANLRDVFPVAAISSCAQQLSSRADLTQYGFARFADDLEQVRRALGYGRLNLFAGSYGTRAAQVYLRAFPQSVRTVYLGSVVPIDLALPLPLAKAAQSALDGVFTACAADAECNAAFPRLREEFRQVLARLDSGVRVSIPNHSDRVPLSRGRVAEWLRSRLYRAEGAASVPWLIHQAHAGNWQPIVDAILDGIRGAESELSFGVFFSITCNEDVAFIRESEIGPETSGTFGGEYRVRQQQAACKQWPKTFLPDAYREPVRSEVPALFVSGDTDPATPLSFTARMAPNFANRIEIVLRGQGHTEWNDCVSALYERFVRAGEVRGLESETCAPVPRPKFRTR
jgi:pimeloyl-ACP methyl ester carboxylesterase